MAPPAAPGPSIPRAWLGFAGFYASSFAVLGAYMQYFPGWLRGAGRLGEAQVSAVLAAQTIARTLAGPLWAQRVDRSGDARRVLLLLSAASAFAFALFAAGSTVLALAAAAFVFGALYSPMYPILDAAALQSAHQHGYGFGRLRMVGSLSFLATILVVGRCLDAFGSGLVFWFVLAGLVAMAAAAAALPRGFAGTQPHERAPVPWWQPLRSRPFVLLLVAAAAIQGSHAAFYNLSTLHWSDHGISKTVAGVLWAEGIVAEIALFFVARRTVERVRPTTLLMLGGAAAVVRWIVVGATTEVAALAAVGWLHAASFGCTYLGALRALERRVPLAQRATAQGLLGSATSGVGMVVGGLVGGFAYERWRGAGFFLMAALAALGAGLAFCLRRMADHEAKPASSSASDNAA